MAEFNISRFKYIWKGIWASGRTFSKDDIVAVGGKAYVCLIGHIASAVSFDEDLNALDEFGNPQPRWELLADGTRWTGNWTANRKYNQNELVKDGATIYRCIVGHTSDPLTINGLGADVEKWEFVARTTQWRDAWIAERKYRVGDMISYNGITYVSNTEHTSASIVAGLENDIEKWDIVNVSDSWIGPWTVTTRYRENDIVVYGGTLYRCISGHTSSALSLETDSNNWTIVSSNVKFKGFWQENTLYNVKDVVRVENVLYIATQIHTSTDTFIDSTWSIFIPGLAFEGEYDPNTTYQIGDIVKYGGYSYVNQSTNNVNTPPQGWNILNTAYNFEGEWNLTNPYQAGDVVSFGGALYVALKNTFASYPVYNRDSTTFLVTVANTANGNRYLIGDDVAPALYVETGQEYIFDLSSESLLTHAPYISLSQDGHHDDAYNFLLEGIQYLLDDQIVSTTEWFANFDTTTNRKIKLDLPQTLESTTLYIVCGNHPNMYGDGFINVARSNVWSQITSSVKYKGSWEEFNQDSESIEYYPGDVVLFRGAPYKCVQLHSTDDSTLVNPEFDDGSYWELIVQGSVSNKLNSRGDLKTGYNNGTFEVDRLPIGNPGSVLNANDGSTIAWLGFDANPKVYYVATNGEDSPLAGSKAQPFNSVKYACDFISEDSELRSPATIFVTTGSYSEILPIVVPPDTAIVGDELRSTVIKPAPGFETSDMFRMRNGSGLRNCTLQGLSGILGPANEYFTKRPTAGAYVALDPGIDTTDEAAWITNKSPYVQNVTTFGTGCIGLKIDGDLHDGGNKSIVANDFTQVLSDGIGVWVNADARSELVSVFCYYNHIGYLAENGGTIRATNGNSSYGDYGAVAEGFLQAEVPIDAEVDHRSLESTVGKVYFYDGAISALGYINTGQNYSSLTYDIVGSGFGALLGIGGYRRDGVFTIRLLEADDSSSSSGRGFTNISNFAQQGDTTSITIANNDEVQDPARYVGQTIFIVDGPGSGQYGIIKEYDVATKVANVQTPEGFDGWSNVQPGRKPVLLNDSSRYVIEPTFNIDSPEYGDESFSTGSFKQIGCGVITDNLTVFGPASGDVGVYSTDGTTFINMSLPEGGNYVKADFDGTYVWCLKDDGLLARSVNGSNWTFYNLPTGPVYSNLFTTQTYKFALRNDSNVLLRSITAETADDWADVPLTLTEGTGLDFITYVNSLFVVGNKEGDFFISQDGSSWTPIANPTQSGAYEVTSIAGGNNLLMIALEAVDGTSPTIFNFALMTDVSNGVTWTFAGNAKTNEVTNTSINKFYLTYQGGLFFAISETGSINTSQDGFNWTAKTPIPGTYRDIISGYSDRQRFFGINTTLSSSVNLIFAGARTIARPDIDTGRVQQFFITEPGSGYTSIPELELIDNGKTTDITPLCRVTNDVLGPPEILSQGQEYTRASITVSGDGFKDEYPTGQLLYVKNLSRIPGPGDTLSIQDISESYSIQKISNISGDEGFYNAILQVSPSIDVNISPEHEDSITIRQRYSQVRMTGHDFLDVGTGNFGETAYPTLYNFGYDSGENNPKPNQEVVFGGGGRVFYTSTDQDGNFRVGELFEVEQASGIVTISATQFNLEGLEELRLGGIVLGGSSAVIREFSTDPTFIANSDSIVPTQKAIASYIANRISSGGSRIFVNTTIAGNITITGLDIGNRADNIITVEEPANLKGGATGTFLALQLFTK